MKPSHIDVHRQLERNLTKAHWKNVDKNLRWSKGEGSPKYQKWLQAMICKHAHITILKKRPTLNCNLLLQKLSSTTLAPKFAGHLYAHKKRIGERFDQEREQACTAPSL